MDKSQHTAAYRRLTLALKAARERAGLTQQQVAAAVGAYASFVSKVESGERRVDVVELAVLCRAYGVSVDDLLRAARIG
jgi:transcriptional regulator with XRE-family HTH domain